MNPQPKSTALSTDLNNFIIGVSRKNSQNAPDLTKIGLNLLKVFPAARDAVLDFFALVFTDAVNVSISQNEYESDSNGSSSLESVNMIGPDLCSLGPPWAPIIAPWCIYLIVDIATKNQNEPNTSVMYQELKMEGSTSITKEYSKHLQKKEKEDLLSMRISKVIAISIELVDSALQSAEPIRVLLDITTQNLTLLIPDKQAKCIDMLIGSRVCSWAVGWVGRAVPALVAPRALTLSVDDARAVLAHLASYPPALIHVRAALRDLLQEAIREDAKPENKREVIPYLLNLASKSEIVLKALTQDIEQTLTPDTIERLTILCVTQRHTPAWEGVTSASLVTLLTRSNVRCFLLLLRCAKDIVFCRQLLESLLQKLEHDSLYPERRIPLIMSAAEKINEVRDKLLTGSQLEQFYVARILILVSHNLPSEFVSIISYLVQYSRSEPALALLVRIISGTMRMHTPQANHDDMNMDTERYHNNVKTGIEYALRDSMLADMEIKKCFIDGSLGEEQKTYTHHFCLNIIKLLRWENSNRVAHLRTRLFSRAVEANIHRIGGALQQYSSLLRERHERTLSQLDEMNTCHALAEVLDRVDMSDPIAHPPSVEAILKVVQATVNYFFRCMHLKDIIDKLRGVQTACRLLRKLCIHSEFARAVALRDLLETAMFREEKLFGSRGVVPNTVPQAKDWTNEDLLFHEYRKHCPITQLTQSHTSVFHAGIIGKGARKQNDDPTENPPILTTNNELLMSALTSCMDGNSGIVEGATSLSLLLVELISPDVMYNGLPWPDEDFTKHVSIERELYMSDALQGCSVARAALRRAAAARPALCHASVLLRASAAATLQRHRATRDENSQSLEMGREQAALTELLSTMVLGQLLPHPLSHMLGLAPQLSAAEIVQMLRDCLWNYTRDHAPAPALITCDSTGLHWRRFSTCKPSTTYTDPLRIIIQKRISKLGHMYPIMFLNL